MASVREPCEGSWHFIENGCTKVLEIQGTQRTNESTLRVNVTSSRHVERPPGRERIKWTMKVELDLLTCDQKAHHLHSF